MNSAHHVSGLNACGFPRESRSLLRLTEANIAQSHQIVAVRTVFQCIVLVVDQEIRQRHSKILDLDGIIRFLN